MDDISWSNPIRYVSAAVVKSIDGTGMSGSFTACTAELYLIPIAMKKGLVDLAI
jgi:hypothetical protein